MLFHSYVKLPEGYRKITSNIGVSCRCGEKQLGNVLYHTYAKKIQEIYRHMRASCVLSCARVCDLYTHVEFFERELIHVIRVLLHGSDGLG